ncbi:ssk1 response regulator receiver [Orbilia oligospora]|uniref:Ssk1 response regulator receiver n=1 Tax=Orbilia oligospora TaxID=2813651 RepID=A0A7C8PIN0_ORBOL|nr:ssk1 response regulator receiver [Orbilia oligospora]TGJ66449.1 ssk1 response regulator receiver [Orbilia oligospora]
MLLWKAAATKLRGVKGMRGFRDKIKGTKTKLLRRDSKDSTEEASAVRPSKTAKGGPGTGTETGSGGSGEGSWGRKSKRHSLIGRDPSRSDQSLVAPSDRTFDTTTDLDTTSISGNGNANPTASANGDIVIEGGTAPKRRSAGKEFDNLEDGTDLQPQLLNTTAKPLELSPAPPLTDTTGSIESPSTAAPDKGSVNCEPPVVLSQKDSSNLNKNGILVGVEGRPTSQIPLAENENLQPQPQPQPQPPQSNAAATAASAASVSALIQPSEGTPSKASTTGQSSTLSLPSNKTLILESTTPAIPSTSTTPTNIVATTTTAAITTTSVPAPTTTISRTPSRKLSDRSSDLSINTTNLPPPFTRPYRLSQFPTDSSGLRADTDSSALSQLQRSSSRASLGIHEPIAPETVEPPVRDKREPSFSHGPETLVYTGPLLHNPPEPASVVPVATEVAQTLHTVSETGTFQPTELARNESVVSRNESVKSRILSSSGSRRKHPISFSRRQSLIHPSDTGLLRYLLEQESASPTTYGRDGGSNIQSVAGLMPHSENQLRTRKVWVKRPGGSPTQVIVTEDDFVDTVRDLCLRKYANALGRHYDSPDLMIRISPPLKPQSARARQMGNMQTHTDRLLNPDEVLCQLLDDYYPNGQTSEDALIVEVPQQQRSRTPRPSPGPHSMSYAYGQTVHDLQLPGEDYFTPVGTIVPSIPHSQSGTVRSTHNLPANPSSLSNYIANSPPPSSPGHRSLKRPGPVRMTTGSPVGSTTSSAPGGGGGGVMLIPRAGGGVPDRIRATNVEAPTSPSVPPQMVALPSSPGIIKPIPQKPASPGVLPAVTSPPAITRPPPKSKEITASIGTLDGQVPSINVLIVEDNIINLRLLEAFMKRLKVRWATAMNGREAVTKWRTGGFQLVLMDIQLPIMNGLDATKEIRRLERLNGIGSFSSSPSGPEDELSSADKLDKSLVFKGSVIIVALTASSLRSDRDEALAVGCNDFLTKPVNFTFLERKVMEWGCMQALIDFEGWRKWKDLASKPGASGGKTSKGGRGKASASASAAAKKGKESSTPALDNASSSSSTPQPTQPAPIAGQS